MAESTASARLGGLTEQNEGVTYSKCLDGVNDRTGHECDEVMGYDVPATEGPPSPEQIGHAAQIVLRMFSHNDPKYGHSWCKRGYQGIHHNVARKFDRMDLFVVQKQLPQRFDDVIDHATYAVMQLGWHIRNRPSDFATWLRENPQFNPAP